MANIGLRAERFEDQVARAWSSHFGCAPEDLDCAGTTLVPLERMAGSGAIHLAHLRARAFAEIDPGLEGELRSALDRQGGEARLTGALVRESVQATRLQAHDRGFIFHLDPDRLIVHAPRPPVRMRVLAEADRDALQALFERCQADEVDDAYVEVGHEIACGGFVGERMVACGSGYRRHGFIDLGVLTDPDYRGRRLAPAMVGVLSQRCMDRGALAMYRCDETNTASRRVAETAGFTLCFHTESLKLAVG
ncbi:MAG: GNAT family N-acetyltransferase [Chloroflexi bacterium]|nr:GNAT family N-acetyltransferase [Chloroflexota bacterium]